MMKGFILKLIRLEVRPKRKTLMQRKYYKMAQEMLDQANLLMTESRNRTGTKRYGDSFEHLYRKHRRSAKPKFLAR